MSLDLRSSVINPNYKPLPIDPRLTAEIEAAPLDTLCAVLGVSTNGRRAAAQVRAEIFRLLLGPGTWARSYLCNKLRENGFHVD